MNLIGDAVHNFIDGLIIGASYLTSLQIGITTTLAVMLHEIPQEIGDFSVLMYGGFKRSKALLLNFVTALTAIAGTIISLIIGSYFNSLTNFLLPFAIGNFIYIALSDLIPELHKETDPAKSVMQLAMLIFGIGIMYLLLFLE
jgi:zinc and cadmium transporter